MQEIPFVAVLGSQIHLNAFKALYFSEKEKGNKLTGDIYIRVLSGRHQIAEQELAFAEDCRIIWKPDKQIRIYSADKRKVLSDSIKYNIKIIIHGLPDEQNEKSFYYIAEPPFRLDPDVYYELVRRHPDRKIEVIYLEEGLRTYLFNGDKLSSKKLLKSKHVFLSKVKYCFKTFLMWRVLEKALERNNRNRYFYLFEKTDMGIQPNKEVCAAFANIFGKDPIAEKTRSDYKNAVVISTQFFFELTHSNEDIECYQRIIPIFREMGIEVIIKPHPKENNLERYNDLGIIIDNNSHIAQEELLARCTAKPLAIIGFFSTTLITAKLFWDIPGISLGKMIPGTSISYYKNDLDRFVELFHDQVFVPKDEQELISVLKRIRDHK